jgi:arylsulfatase A-like enzyme
MASLWTGLYPRRTGVTRFNDAVAQEAVMPAEILRDAGFRTAGIFRNGWVSNNFGFDQGFHRYYEPKPSRDPERFKRRNPSAHPLQGTDLDATQSAVEFLSNHGNERFLLYIHYMDVHQYLYDEGSALFGSNRVGAYDNAIHWTDRNLSYLVRTLQDQDLLDRTLIVITADHGEGFFEHGVEGHARTLYHEVTEVPLVFVLPFRLEPGLVVETPVQNVDVWPTILDLLGLPPLPGADGRSLVPLIEAAATGNAAPDGSADRTAISDLDRSWGLVGVDSRPMVSLLEGDYRFIHRSFKPEEPELYDRSSDPQELRNLAAKEPERVSELRARAQAYLATQPNWDPPQVELDDMRAAQLRALGYVIGKKEGEKPEAEGEANPE